MKATRWCGIRIEPKLREQFLRFAKKNKLSLSTFLRMAAIEKMERGFDSGTEYVSGNRRLSFKNKSGTLTMEGPR